MYEQTSKIFSNLFESQHKIVKGKENLNDQDGFSEHNYNISKFQVFFKEDKSQKKLKLNFQTIESQNGQSDSLVLVASSFTNDKIQNDKIMQLLHKNFKIVQFDYLNFEQYEKDYSINQWIALQIKQILIAVFQQFKELKNIYLLGEINGSCGIIQMLIEMSQIARNKKERESCLRFSVFENLSLTNSQIPQFCDSGLSRQNSYQKVEKIQLEEVYIDEHVLYKLIKGVVLLYPYNNSKNFYYEKLKQMQGINFINKMLLNFTIKMNYPNIFSSFNFSDVQCIDKPVVFIFNQSQNFQQNAQFFDQWGSNVKKVRMSKSETMDDTDFQFIKSFLNRLDQNFYKKKQAKYSMNMYISEVWKNDNNIIPSDLMSCETKTLQESRISQSKESKRDTFFSNSESMISQVIFKNNNKNEMIKRVQQNNMPKKKKSHFGFIQRKNKIKENVFNQFVFNQTVVEQQMNLNLEELEKLYKESDNLMSKINNIEELCEPAQQFIDQITVQKVKEKEFVFKLWANQLINKLYHFETDLLPTIMIELINKCIEYNFVNCSNYQMLKRYKNLPDYQNTMETPQISSQVEDKFINSTLYSKLRKILQIDDSQYFVDGMVGNSLLDLNGNFVWMDQQAQDIFEVQSLKEGGVNFFDLLVDESKVKIQQKLGTQNSEQIQLLDPETMENRITYIIFSKNKQKKIQNFMRKKNIKKVTNLNDQYFFNLYLKCLVSHLQLTQVVFNIKNLGKEFEEIQAEDPSHFEDKKINKIEDQFQNELNLSYFKNTKKKGDYLIKMSTKISKTFMITNVQNERIDFVPKAPTCNIKLVKSFGFGGFSEPTPTKLLMCPFIENSCCTTFDQEEIYSRWVIEREREEVQQRFEFYSNVYVRLLKKGETFHDLLLEIIKQMQVKSFSNCKIIASRLAQFQFKIISEQLQEAIKNMYNYYNDLYNGLYCTICDADSQPFFRVQKEAIQYQKKFCRDIISQSLNVLLYLHINLKKYFNLATRFVTNCDFQGNYTKSDAEDSKIFTISKENYDLLTDCKAYRNEIFWMDYCEPICQKFNLFDLDKFFTPDLKQFAYYNRFFGESIEKLKKQQEKAKKKQEKMKQQEVRGLMDFRILEENQKKQEDEDDDENKKEKSDNYYMELVDSYMEQPIYYEPAKAPFDISKFKSIFADSDIGIDMTVIGKKTDISEKIKQSIEAEKKVIAQKQIEEQNLKQLEEITESVVEKKSDKKIHNSIGANTKLFNTIFGMFFFLLNFFNQFY